MGYGRDKLMRPLQAAVFAVAYSCTPQVPPNSVPPRLPLPMVSSWESGSCSLLNNTLRYSSDSRAADLLLDVPVRDGEGRRLHCSADLTVILTDERAVVSLGGDAVLEGRLSLGSIGSIFTLANSYSIDLRQINDEDGSRVSERVLDGRLQIATGRGRQWTIDLFNPESWDIY